MYTLYTFAVSSTAWRARIALSLKGIKVDYVYLNLFKGEHRSEEYRQINPNAVSIMLSRVCLLLSSKMAPIWFKALPSSSTSTKFTLNLIIFFLGIRF